jgi:hypothetical protein
LHDFSLLIELPFEVFSSVWIDEGTADLQALEARLLRYGVAAVEGTEQLADHEEASEALLAAVRQRVSRLQEDASRNPVLLITEKARELCT